MRQIAILICILCCMQASTAQRPLDTTLRRPANAAIQPPEAVVKAVLADTGHSPRKATLRSAILPGWGQAYNREYWKIPIVYGALSIPAITWVFNNNWYRRTREAFEIRALADTPRFGNIHPQLRRLDAGSLLRYRNQYRRDRDYSVLWFLIIWGLNVVDATVFAHLKEFNVSDDLSLRVVPKVNGMRQPQMGLVLGFRQKTTPVKHTTF